MEKIEMLEILKTRLPDGLEIVKVKNRGNSSHVEIVFSYRGQEKKGSLRKTCAPTYENRVCDATINNVMAAFAIDRGDLAEAKHWLDKVLSGEG